jgi:hypothetical protein
MNDLDLRAALHRDADLAGEPSPDLLAQLARRGDQQRRRRAGGLTAALGVVVIGASIPLAQSFMTHADSGPAVQTTDEPTPTSVPLTPEPTAVVPEVSPTPSSGAPVADAPVVETPACPDTAELGAALPPDTDRRTYEIHPEETVCGGPWAGHTYTVTEIYRAGDVFDYVDDQGNPAQGVEEADSEWGNSEAGLWRYVDGSWTFVGRDGYCDKVTLPDVIYQRVCTVD